MRYVDPTGFLTQEHRDALEAADGTISEEELDDMWQAFVDEEAAAAREKVIQEAKEILGETVVENLLILAEHGEIYLGEEKWPYVHWDPYDSENIFEKFLEDLFGDNDPKIVNLLTGEIKPAIIYGQMNFIGPCSSMKLAKAALATAAALTALKAADALLDSNKPVLAKPWNKESYPGEMEGKRISELNKSNPQQGKNYNHNPMKKGDEPWWALVLKLIDIINQQNNPNN